MTTHRFRSSSLWKNMQECTAFFATQERDQFLETGNDWSEVLFHKRRPFVVVNSWIDLPLLNIGLGDNLRTRVFIFLYLSRFFLLAPRLGRALCLSDQFAKLPNHVGEKISKLELRI